MRGGVGGVGFDELFSFVDELWSLESNTLDEFIVAFSFDTGASTALSVDFFGAWLL